MKKTLPQSNPPWEVRIAEFHRTGIPQGKHFIEQALHWRGRILGFFSIVINPVKIILGNLFLPKPLDQCQIFNTLFKYRQYLPTYIPADRRIILLKLTDLSAKIQFIILAHALQVFKVHLKVELNFFTF